MQQQAGEQEHADHQVQGQAEAVVGEVVDEIDGGQRDDQQAKNAAVIEALGAGLAGNERRRRVDQQLRRSHSGRSRHHRPVEQRCTDHQQGDDGQVEGGEQCVLDANGGGQHPATDTLQVRATGGQGQWHRARQAAMPDQKARIGCRHQQRVMHAPHLPRQRPGEHRTNHQAEAPVHPGGGHRYQGDEHDGLPRRAGNARQAVQQPGNRWRVGQRMTGDQHQGHLHGEGQQVPETAAPVLGHLRQALAGGEDAQRQYYQGQQHGEHEGRRQEALNQVDAQQRDP
ncbi:hypothetical protein SRABI70_03991 [Pseudomonas sp. Bi70]|nr:hypothetical protein SRABI70_03991 [Pseudomonas sp. Bi70]